MMRYRSIFLSDFHMGAKSFDAPALLAFLKRHDADYIYLVGDIFDGWKLAKRWHWSESCSEILDEILRKKENGAKITYLPGNHDEDIRHLLPLLRLRYGRRLGVRLRDKAIHTMADGRRFVVLHGDQFDRKILRGALSQWSDRLYDLIMDMMGAYGGAPKVKIKGRVKKFSLAKSLSKHGQWALYLLNNFEAAIYKMVKGHGAHGLICGHTHIPVIKNIRDITYANSGCWLRRGHTALAETYEGALTLIDWPATYEVQPQLFESLHPVSHRARPDFALTPSARDFRPTTKKILRTLRRIWRSKKKIKNKGNEQATAPNRATLNAFNGLLSACMSPEAMQKNLPGARNLFISCARNGGDYKIELLSRFAAFAQIQIPREAVKNAAL